MRVISKFHDYYDTVSQYGIDLTQIYVRNTEEDKPKDKSWDDFKEYLGVSDRFPCFRFDYLIVGVCGRFHLCIKMTHSDNPYGRDSVRYCYSLSQMKDFIYELCSSGKLTNKERDQYLDIFNRNPSTNKWFSSNTRMDVGLFDRFDDDIGSKDFTNIFIQQECPVLLLKDKRDFTIVKNPNLSDLNFQRVLDAFTIHQELSMFLGCVIINPTKKGTKVKKRPEGWVDPLSSDDFSNEVKRDSKGFDKMSFKKEKTKRRK